MNDSGKIPEEWYPHITEAISRSTGLKPTGGNQVKEPSDIPTMALLNVIGEHEMKIEKLESRVSIISFRANFAYGIFVVIIMLLVVSQILNLVEAWL
jgi:hypothetical protein